MHDSAQQQQQQQQQQKMNVLFENHQPKHDPNRVIFNYLNVFPSGGVKLLVKELHFVLLTKKLYADFTANLEPFYITIENLDVFSNGD